MFESKCGCQGVAQVTLSKADYDSKLLKDLKSTY